jgi:hypothetical protein
MNKIYFKRAVVSCAVAAVLGATLVAIPAGASPTVPSMSSVAGAMKSSGADAGFATNWISSASSPVTATNNGVTVSLPENATGLATTRRVSGLVFGVRPGAPSLTQTPPDGVSENSGTGVRIQSERLSENSRNRHPGGPPVVPRTLESSHEFVLGKSHIPSLPSVLKIAKEKESNDRRCDDRVDRSWID